MTFIRSLNAAWTRNNSLLCVGLDPDTAEVSGAPAGRDDAIFEFCRASSMPRPTWCAASKPQIAYFAARRAEDQLEALIAHIHEKHPGIPVILDAKRGDIGSTAEQYAIEGLRALPGRRHHRQPLHGPRFGRTVPGLQGTGRDPALPHLEPGRQRPAVPRRRRHEALRARGPAGGEQVEHHRPVRAGRRRHLPGRDCPRAG